MAYLQVVFTTLWSIWTYRYIHHGICPNPGSILILQRPAAAPLASVQRPAAAHQQSPPGQWNLIIKIAAAKGLRAFAYNASNMEGVCVLSGVASTLASSTPGALFEAIIAAATIASHHGFQHILFF